jgi:predicted porin
MSRFFLTFLFVSAIAGAAQAADLPTVKAPEAEPSRPSCFDSFLDYMNSSARDCPLRYGPLTLYGTLDGGYGYSQWGAPLGMNADKVNYAIQRNSGGAHWLWSPNGLSTSTIGLRLSQRIFEQWELIGAAEAGFNPYTFRLIDGPQSLADNNLNRPAYQRTQFDSARAGQWDNGQGFVGVSHPTYGSLTFGRTSSLSNAAVSAYDPVASVAFSQIGFSAGFAAFGVTTTARVNTALTYRLTYQNIRIAAQAQIGGYDQGNAATAQYQGQIGFDYGQFSFDAIGGWAENAQTYSTYGGAALPAGYDPNSIVRGTVQNTGGLELLARYDWDPFKFYAGYIWAVTTNPTNTFYPWGLGTISSGLSVPAGAVTTNNFNIPRVRDTLWTGARYAVLRNLELAAGVYWENQSNFNPGLCTGSGSATSSSRCAGNRWSTSFLVDYRVTPRLNLYAGVLFSEVSGGLASGFLHTSNIAPTAGLRFRF